MSSLIRTALDGFSEGGVKDALRNTRNHMIAWTILVCAILFAFLFLSVLVFFLLGLYVSPITAAGLIFLFWLTVSAIAWTAKTYEAPKPKEDKKMKLTQRFSKMTSGLSSEQKDILKTAAVTVLPFVAKRKILLRLGLPGVALAGLWALKKAFDEKKQ